MSLLAWFDNRTLLGCQVMLAIVFFGVFLAMQRAYPSVRGLRTASTAFFLGFLGILAVFLRGSIPDFISIVISNLLLLSAFIVVYDAITQITGGRRLTKYVWPLLVPVAAILRHYSSVHPDIVPRIIVMTLAAAFILSLSAWQLLTRADAFSSRLTMRTLGYSFVFEIGVQLYRAIMTTLYGAPQNYMTTNSVQTLTLAFNIFFVCSAALCLFFIVNHELITRTRDESEQDALSGAFNRRGIEQRLNTELKRVQRSQHPLTIALIDVDHFKHINDSAGHAVGDVVIRTLVSTITARLRAYDSLGRYGGDEFLLILPQTTSDDASVVIDRLAFQVRTGLRSGSELPVTLSTGLTEAVPGDTSETILDRADKALYDAKRAGRNCSRTLLHDPHATIPILAS